MNIIQAIQDDSLFRPFLADANGSLRTWFNWFAALKALYGLPIPAKRRAMLEECTGRQCASLPASGFETALFLTGRRSGKSRIAAVIGAYEASLAGHESKLAKGERGVVCICSPTKKQSRIVKDYIRAIFQVPLLSQLVVAETKEGFELQNGTMIELLAGEHRSSRGFTLLAVIIDEACFFGLDDTAKIKSDTELVRALKPSLATTNGRLVAISSPYAARGWSYRTYERNFGNDAGRTLVVNCPSRTLNPTLRQSIVDAAMEEDRAMALSEYMGCWRSDVCEFLPRSVIEQLVVTDRLELMPEANIKYHAFADLSGGRVDDAALAIGHRDNRTIILDCLRRYKAPHNPFDVVRSMAEELRRYRIRHVTADNYSAEYAVKAFESCGIGYSKSDKPKSALYLELLPRMCSGGVELLDDPTLVTQLAGLERRTRVGGKDAVDHPKGGRDDVSNAVAGLCVVAAKSMLVGAL